MAPQPRYGEIEIDGTRWRWATVGHFQGSPAPEQYPARVRWSVCFRAVEDPARHLWAEIPSRDSEDLTEGALRRLFDDARSALREPSAPVG